MPTDHGSVPNPSRRLPRKGFLFTLVRSFGVLLQVTGLLLLGIAVIGFILLLVRIAPTFVETLQHLDQKMAGFMFLISVGYLLIFPIIGLVGAAIAGIGLALRFVGTERRVNFDGRVGQIMDESAKEPPTKSAA